VLATLAVLTIRLALAYTQVVPRGSWTTDGYWRNIRFVIGANWIFNITMFTMFYAADGTLPKWYNWVIQISFTIVIIALALYRNRKRRRRNDK
jgi:hypothetical protein